MKIERIYGASKYGKILTTNIRPVRPRLPHLLLRHRTRPAPSHRHRQGSVRRRIVAMPGAPDHIMHGTPFIIVCPMFFTHSTLESYPPPNTCAKLTPDKTRFEEDSRQCVQYRMWILLEEIAHYYITMTTGARLDVYSINRCVQMGGGLFSESGQLSILCC